MTRLTLSRLLYPTIWLTVKKSLMNFLTVNLFFEVDQLLFSISIYQLYVFIVHEIIISSKISTSANMCFFYDQIIFFSFSMLAGFFLKTILDDSWLLHLYSVIVKLHNGEIIILTSKWIEYIVNHHCNYTTIKISF